MLLMRIMYIMLNRIIYIHYRSAYWHYPSSHTATTVLCFQKASALTAKYATQLQVALQEAMSTGGPVAAISVCRDLAPAIQSELSRQSGANVRRTSLKFRNSGNAPDDWETVRPWRLSRTPIRKKYLETTPSGATRYMKAIPTGAVCLACHGEQLAPEVKAKVSETAYPHDRALGYNPGDIRGAFSITWPAPAVE